MIKLTVVGLMGNMGKALIEETKKSEKFEIVNGIDKISGVRDEINVYDSFDKIEVKPDVVVDFSNPNSLDSIYDYCISGNIPAVICTTGFNEQQGARIKDLSKHIPVFKSANMSLGINILASLAKSAYKMTGDDFDIEILEKHHKYKIDAPSGTALLLADEINEASSGLFKYIYDRKSRRTARENNEIGITSIRAGNIVGEHEIIFGGENEVISISHSALSKSVFASGALKASEFIRNKPKGLYNMNDLLKEKLQF
ncbi:MAG: 4-hydroxy-tetrahydrodipicolinate reductase [Ruminococcaceae bacterium]|nr:4-hydroxy-tetrahydrodipicolinate reductase [Oscillospiraceae bacterium]